MSLYKSLYLNKQFLIELYEIDNNHYIDFKNQKLIENILVTGLERTKDIKKFEKIQKTLSHSLEAFKQSNAEFNKQSSLKLKINNNKFTSVLFFSPFLKQIYYEPIYKLYKYQIIKYHIIHLG
jgi:hypothetical protein